MADLNSKWRAYIIALKAAATTAQDVTTLVAKDRPTIVAAAPTEVDDANTLYFKALP
jgi:hypothetical protein